MRVVYRSTSLLTSNESFHSVHSKNNNFHSSLSHPNRLHGLPSIGLTSNRKKRDGIALKNRGPGHPPPNELINQLIN